jgi:hypothetical protein
LESAKSAIEIKLAIVSESPRQLGRGDRPRCPSLPQPLGRVWQRALHLRRQSTTRSEKRRALASDELYKFNVKVFNDAVKQNDGKDFGPLELQELLPRVQPRWKEQGITQNLVPV